MKKWMKEANWLKAAGVFTLVYLVIATLVIGPLRTWEFITTGGKLNEIGDFLAGVFSPLAFIWLVAAVLTQRQELDETRDQFAENQKVVDAQMKTITSQNGLLAQQHKQAEDSARRTYRLSLFEQRYKLYEEFIAFGKEHDPNHFRGDAYLEMVELIQRASFLFGKEIEDWFADIAQAIHDNEENWSRFTTVKDDGYGNETVEYANAEVEEEIRGTEAWLWEQFSLADDRAARFRASLHVSDI